MVKYSKKNSFRAATTNRTKTGTDMEPKPNITHNHHCTKMITEETYVQSDIGVYVYVVYVGV